jgi:hypothetical protein
MLDLGFDAGMARVKPNWVSGETALHVAAAHGCRSVAELLIERGAPLESRLQGGRTPLRVAFLCLEQQSEWTPNENSLPIAEALIEAGASVEDAGLTLTAAVCLGRGDDIARLAKGASAQEKQKTLAAAAYNGGWPQLTLPSRWAPIPTHRMQGSIPMPRLCTMPFAPAHWRRCRSW